MKYFTLTELAKSDTAKILKIDNTIPEEYKKNAEDLVDNILDPLRTAYGHPISVTSCYRCDALNKAVGGSKTSSHCYALAADIVPTKGNVDLFIKFAITWFKENNIQMDQVIREESKGGKKWLHVSYKNKDGKQRNQYLDYKNGKYTILK